ncbi:hypothetical protein TIFTF001_041752 [Ficus carica]|uniref:Uncharacterized protein n=1 Tax=Ficus carica TaxID=3494 RepID=A0AA88DB54_FICCA|nr:hypothetical protein TIFTF001_041752 [Ficus carica]
MSQVAEEYSRSLSQSRSRSRWRRLKLLRRCLGGAAEESEVHRSSRSGRGLASVAASSWLVFTEGRERGEWVSLWKGGSHGGGSPFRGGGGLGKLGDRNLAAIFLEARGHRHVSIVSDMWGPTTLNVWQVPALPSSHTDLNIPLPGTA